MREDEYEIGKITKIGQNQTKQVKIDKYEETDKLTKKVKNDKSEKK